MCIDELAILTHYTGLKQKDNWLVLRGVDTACRRSFPVACSSLASIQVGSVPRKWEKGVIYPSLVAHGKAAQHPVQAMPLSRPCIVGLFGFVGHIELVGSARKARRA